MIYELHLTVDHNHPDFDLEHWVEFCDHNGAKALDIRLFGGKHDRQVMFSVIGQDSGPSSWAYVWRNEWEAAVRTAGFKILRSKTEVPLDKSADFTEPVYHEAHIKSLIPSSEATDLVQTLYWAGWMASYNDLFASDAGLEKWYFTWRAYNVPFIQAGREFAEAFADLSEVCWHTVRMESETVIHDSNPSLDEGWA